MVELQSPALWFRLREMTEFPVRSGLEKKKPAHLRAIKWAQAAFSWVIWYFFYYTINNFLTSCNFLRLLTNTVKQQGTSAKLEYLSSHSWNGSLENGDGSREDAFEGTAGVDVWHLTTCTHTESSQFVVLVLSATLLQMGRDQVRLNIRNVSVFSRTSLELRTRWKAWPSTRLILTFK